MAKPEFLPSLESPIRWPVGTRIALKDPLSVPSTPLLYQPLASLAEIVHWPFRFRERLPQALGEEARSVGKDDAQAVSTAQGGTETTFAPPASEKDLGLGQRAASDEDPGACRPFTHVTSRPPVRDTVPLWTRAERSE